MNTKEQYPIPSKVKKFLIRYGLKQCFIADTCKIQRTALSAFMHNKLALSDRQLDRIKNFMDDYERRMS